MKEGKGRIRKVKNENGKKSKNEKAKWKKKKTTYTIKDNIIVRGKDNCKGKR